MRSLAERRAGVAGGHLMAALGERLWPPNGVQLVLVAVVAATGGLVTFSVGAPLSIVVAATVVGIAVGAALTAYVTWILPSSDFDERRREF